MFNIEETFDLTIPYRRKNDFYAKGFSSFFGVLCFLEILKSQIPQVELVQLVPGFYFLLFVFLFIFFELVSLSLFRIPFFIDLVKRDGTKAKLKYDVKIFAKLSFFFFTSLLYLVVYVIVPLSLDSFVSSARETLENTWSILEVLGVEILLSLIFTIISQIPLYFIRTIKNKEIISVITRYWRPTIVSFTILAGFLTPTLDGYTQTCFATFTFSFYLLIINFLQKRFFFKLNIFVPFGT